MGNVRRESKIRFCPFPIRASACVKFTATTYLLNLFTFYQTQKQHQRSWNNYSLEHMKKKTSPVRLLFPKILWHSFFYLFSSPMPAQISLKLQWNEAFCATHLNLVKSDKQRNENMTFSLKVWTLDLAEETKNCLCLWLNIHSPSTHFTTAPSDSCTWIEVEILL